MSTVFRSMYVTLAPRFFKISKNNLTSLISGRFSSRQTPSIRRQAGMMATAAFFAPADGDLAVQAYAALNHDFFQFEMLLKIKLSHTRAEYVLIHNEA